MIIQVITEGLCNQRRGEWCLIIRQYRKASWTLALTTLSVRLCTKNVDIHAVSCCAQNRPFVNRPTVMLPRLFIR